jgi:hypothetical protein
MLSTTPCRRLSRAARRLVLSFAALASVCSFARFAAADDTLVLLDGKRIAATVTAIDEASGKITAASLAQPVELQGLRRLDRPAKAPAPLKAPFQIYLQGGGVMLAETATIADETVTMKWSYSEKVALPTEAIRAVCFASAVEDAKRPKATDQGRETLAAALAKPAGEKDSLLVMVEGKAQTLTGLVSAWHPGGIEFDWEGQARTIPYSRVYGIVLAQLGAAHDATGETTIATLDGSTTTGRVTRLADGKLTVLLHKSAGSKPIETVIPWDAVQSISVKSNRLVFLSDEKPVDAQVKPIVAIARPWQADKGVLGGPLTLAGRAYEKGLGVASRTELTFQQPTGFDGFAATIGLDASAAGRGNCVFVVRADGKEVYRKAMDGKTPPQEIRVNTAGAQRVALVVEPGEDLDLSDHADWCDARFLKSTK